LEEITISNSMNFGLQQAQGGKKKGLLLVGWPRKLLHFANFHEFFMFMGRVGETINTLRWFCHKKNKRNTFYSVHIPIVGHP
jgi:hypothetical protein